MDAAYTHLADWFEYLNADCDYEKWSQYLHKKLLGAGVAAGRGLDLGCGSGKFTRMLSRMGYGMTGIDASGEMLAAAARMSAQEGIYPQFAQCDVRGLKIPGKADFAVSVNDCFNYVPPADIPRAFAHVKNCLKKGGVFLFDVSSEYKIRQVLGNNSFCEDREDVACMWFCRQTAEGVEMEVTLFIKRADGLFERREERHVQYAHGSGFLRSALESAGFEVLSEEGALGDAQDKMRVNFLCRRR